MAMPYAPRRHVHVRAMRRHVHVVHPTSRPQHHQLPCEAVNIVDNLLVADLCHNNWAKLPQTAPFKFAVRVATATSSTDCLPRSPWEFEVP